MKKRIQRKIEDLRQQPENVRYRAVSYFTVLGGAVLVGLWLTVLLPVQLYLQNPGESQETGPGVFTQIKESFNTASNSSPLPQVGGIQDTGTPSPGFTQSPLPTL